MTSEMQQITFDPARVSHLISVANSTFPLKPYTIGNSQCLYKPVENGLKMYRTFAGPLRIYVSEIYYKQRTCYYKGWIDLDGNHYKFEDAQIHSMTTIQSRRTEMDEGERKVEETLHYLEIKKLRVNKNPNI